MKCLFGVSDAVPPNQTWLNHTLEGARGYQGGWSGRHGKGLTNMPEGRRDWKEGGRIVRD